jgi:hypothetical protein
MSAKPDLIRSWRTRVRLASAGRCQLSTRVHSRSGAVVIFAPRAAFQARQIMLPSQLVATFHRTFLLHNCFRSFRVIYRAIMI